MTLDHTAIGHLILATLYVTGFRLHISKKSDGSYIFDIRFMGKWFGNGKEKNGD